MPERQVAKNLQLDETAERSSSFMELEDGGQVDSRWQLRTDPSANDWQPVEYSRPNQSEPSWIMPSIVGLVLICVAGYLLYTGLSRLSDLNIASVPAETLPSDDSTAGTDDGDGATGGEQPAPAVAAVAQATSTALPADEPTAAPTPTDEPTVAPTVALVEQQIATITNQFGVNARLEPSTSGEVLRILEEGETVIVLDEQESDDIEGNWLQVRTSEEAVVWISSQFVDIETQLVPGDPAVAVSPLPDLDVRVTISSPAGLNARAEPDAASEIVALLPDDTSYPALSQSADGQWIEVELEDGSTAWIFLQLVIADASLSSLPTPQERAEAEAAALAAQEAAEAAALAAAEEAAAEEEPEIADTGSITETETITDTPALADDAAPVDTSDAVTTSTVITNTDIGNNVELVAGESISITNQFGVNARSTTSTDGEILLVLEEGTAFAITGRNEDSSWLQIALDDGTLAWVFTQAVEAPESLDGFPVRVPPAVGDPAETLDSIEPATAADDDADAATDDTAEDTAAEDAATEEDADVPADDAEAAEEAPADDAEATDAAEDAPADEEEPVVLEDTGITATVTSFLGAKARPAPTTVEEEIDTVPFNQELNVLGRSEDSEWIQVALFADQSAWMLATRVELSAPIDELPVTE